MKRERINRCSTHIDIVPFRRLLLFLRIIQLQQFHYYHRSTGLYSIPVHVLCAIWLLIPCQNDCRNETSSQKNWRVSKQRSLLFAHFFLCLCGYFWSDIKLILFLVHICVCMTVLGVSHKVNRGQNLVRFKVKIVQISAVNFQ